MRIAAIYWVTSSVGGISTNSSTLKRVANEVGDTFHILRSSQYIKRLKGLYKESKKIMGGDSSIIIDGEANHHPELIQDTIKFLEDNYDGLYFLFLCPHPTKKYGNEPVFLPIYTDCKLPKVARISDGYFKHYENFAHPCIEYCNSILVANQSYAVPLIEKGYPVKSSFFPFLPKDIPDNRSKTPLLVWISQWKRIKGLYYFLNNLEELSKRIDVETYSNGIEYYKFRLTDKYKQIFGKDYFEPEYSGVGRVPFYGDVNYDDIIKVLSRAWYMVDLQGMGILRFEAYRNGSYNNTTIEALYYGACPILHSQAKKSKLPQDCCLFVEDASEIIDLVSKYGDFAIDPERQKKAREWVLENHSAYKFYDILKTDLKSGKSIGPNWINNVVEEKTGLMDLL